MRRWYHQDESGYLRRVGIMIEGDGEMAGKSYVRSWYMPWLVPGRGGWREIYDRWVADSELRFQDETASDDTETESQTNNNQITATV